MARLSPGKGWIHSSMTIQERFKHEFRLESRTSNRTAVSEAARDNRWTDDDKEDACQEILEVVAKKDGRVWAGRTRIGGLIMIVDSDTRIPEDCQMLLSCSINRALCKSFMFTGRKGLCISRICLLFDYVCCRIRPYRAFRWVLSCLSHASIDSTSQ